MIPRPAICALAASLALAACQPVSQAPVSPLPPNSPAAHALMPLDSQWDVLVLHGEKLEPGQAMIGILAPEPGVLGTNGAGYQSCNSASGLAFAPLGLPGGNGISTLIGCAPEDEARDMALGAALEAAQTIGPGAQPGTVDLIAEGQRLMTVRRQADKD